MTLQPFGDTEKQEKHRQDKLDSDVLDLNASVETLKENVADGLPKGAATPSSILKVLPSIPFLSSRSSSEEESPEAEAGPSSSAQSSPTKDRPRHRSSIHQEASRTTEIPNPIEASKPGENTDLPPRDEKLSEREDTDLPAVEPGAGDGPEVLYGKSVVLDMAGYHSQPKDRPTTSTSSLEEGDSTPDPALTSVLINTLTDDLKSSARLLSDSSRPILHHHSASEPPMYDDDELDVKSEPDLSSLTLDDDRSVRATSEPPETPPRFPRKQPTSPTSQRPHSPGLMRAPNGTVFPSMLPQPAVMDLAWDWGGRAKGEGSSAPLEKTNGRQGEVESPPLLPERTRSESMPVRTTAPGRLKNVEENPHLFVLEMTAGRSHTFELSLCGKEGFASQGQAGVGSDLTLHATGMLTARTRKKQHSWRNVSPSSNSSKIRK